MINLLPYFNTDEGRYLANMLFNLRKKYLSDEYLRHDANILFDGTTAKGYIAEITLHANMKISNTDLDLIRKIYSYFVG